MSLFWNPTFGTAVRGLQGLARGLGHMSAVPDAGTYVADDGSTYTISSDGSVVSSTASDTGYPTVYGPGAAATAAAFTGASAGATVGTNPDFWGGAIAGARDFALALLQGKQTYDLTQLNMQLVKAGKPPLSTAQAQAIAPQVRFGLAADTQKMLMYGGIALAAVLVLPKLMK